MKNPLPTDAAGDLVKRVPRVALIAVAVLLVALLAVAYALFSGGSGDDTDAFNAAYRPIAQRVATSLDKRFAPYRAALADMAANADVQATLAAGDGAAMAALADTLKPALDGILALRLLPVTVRAPEPDAVPPLTYASISMLRKALESGRNPAAEVHLAGTEREHLVLVARVEGSAAEADSEAPLLGFVHLSLEPDLARGVLDDVSAGDAFVELFQAPAVKLARVGNDPGAAATSVTVPVRAARFAVRVKAAGVPERDGGSILPLAGGGVLVLLLLGAGAYWFTQRPQVRVAAPSAGDRIFAGAIQAIYEGAHPGLEQLLPGSKTDRTNFDLETLDDGVSGDDVTTFKAAGDSVDEDPTVPRTEADDSAVAPVAEAAAEEVPVSIFRSYDIRGIVDETLTEDGVYQIGRALGAEAEARGQKTVVVARDGRHSSEPLVSALSKGLLESGRDVLDIGLAPTPVLYFATHFLDARSGVMITGSHNPAQYNGLKIVLDGETLSGEAIQAIRRRVVEQDFIEGTGSQQSADIVAEYIRRISEEIPVSLGRAMKVVVDCGNGVPGAVAPDVLRAIGHDVIELYCDVDGDFPNHHPDPSQPENLADLINAVQDESADLGLAFDGDGDRLGVVDAEGNVIWPDRQMILFARDILSRNAGAKVIYDVKCSRLLAEAISEAGGEPIMSKTGHSLIKSRMQETGALLAGEMSGHIFFKERWYGFDDAIYSAARLMEILVNSSESPAELFAALPGGVATPELRLDMPEERHGAFMDEILAAASFDDGEISTIDGLRVDFADSWGLVRPSNTTPCLVLRFEGDDDAALEGVKTRFRDLIKQVDASLDIPF